MSEKDLKKMNRYQLLELLLVQTERADSLQAQLERIEKELSEQKVRLSSMGSIAEASLQISGVFQSAQQAADLYLAAAKKHAAEIEEAARRKGAEILTQALQEARRIKEEG